MGSSRTGWQVQGVRCPRWPSGAVLVPEAWSARRGLTLWRSKEEKIMKHKLVFSSLLLALSLASAPTARAITTWYVDGAHGSDSNNCASSQTACKTIGHAIALAHSGDSIMVAAATYKENRSEEHTSE